MSQNMHNIIYIYMYIYIVNDEEFPIGVNRNAPIAAKLVDMGWLLMSTFKKMPRIRMIE